MQLRNNSTTDLKLTRSLACEDLTRLHDEKEGGEDHHHSEEEEEEEDEDEESEDHHSEEATQRGPKRIKLDLISDFAPGDILVVHGAPKEAVCTLCRSSDGASLPCVDLV